MFGAERNAPSVAPSVLFVGAQGFAKLKMSLKPRREETHGSFGVCGFRCLGCFGLQGRSLLSLTHSLARSPHSFHRLRLLVQDFESVAQFLLSLNSVSGRKRVGAAIKAASSQKLQCRVSSNVAPRRPLNHPPCRTRSVWCIQ